MSDRGWGFFRTPRRGAGATSGALGVDKRRQSRSGDTDLYQEVLAQG